MEIITSFIKKFKLVQLLLITIIVTGAFIVLSDSVLEQLGVLSIKNAYHEWIGLGFIVSSAGLIIISSEKLYKFAHSKYNNLSRLGRQTLKKLTVEEQQILIENFYDFDSKKFRMTSYIDVTTEVPTLLTSRGLAIRSASMSYGHKFPYTMHPYIYEILEKNINKGNIQINQNTYVWNCK